MYLLRFCPALHTLTKTHKPTVTKIYLDLRRGVQAVSN